MGDRSSKVASRVKPGSCSNATPRKKGRPLPGRPQTSHRLMGCTHAARTLHAHAEPRHTTPLTGFLSHWLLSLRSPLPPIPQGLPPLLPLFMKQLPQPPPNKWLKSISEHPPKWLLGQKGVAEIECQHPNTNRSPPQPSPIPQD